MEVSVISDRISSISKSQSQSAANFLHRRRHSFQISAVIRPMDAAVVKSHNNVKKPRRGLLTKRRRRTKRMSRTEAGGGPDDGGDGPYSGTGGGGSGGGGDNYGFNWDESSSDSPADRAFDIVYEILSWIVFSNCLHFAVKKIIRSMTNGIAGASPVRGKVPLSRLTPVC